MTSTLPPKGLVLYADDDLDDLQFIVDAFSEYQSQIDLVTFPHGADLLAYLSTLPEATTPCLVILDVNMPVLNGKETLQAIRAKERFLDMPVVLFSTSTMPLEREFASQYGASFINKPLNIHQLEAIVIEMITHCAGDLKNRLRGNL